MERKRTLYENYETAEILQEQEANYFACALLMPRDLFLDEYEKRKDVNEDKRIKELAEVFQVPLFAVVMRLTMLAAIEMEERREQRRQERKKERATDAALFGNAPKKRRGPKPKDTGDGPNESAESNDVAPEK